MLPLLYSRTAMRKLQRAMRRWSPAETRGFWWGTRRLLRVLRPRKVGLVVYDLGDSVKTRWDLRKRALESLAKCAETATAGQFRDALSLGQRLVRKQIDPGPALGDGMLAIIQGSTNVNEYEANLSSLESLATFLHKAHRYYYHGTLEMDALLKLAQSGQFSRCLELAVQLAEHGVDPKPTLEKGLPACLETLSGAQMGEAINSAESLARKKIDPAVTLEQWIAGAGKMLPPEHVGEAIALGLQLADHPASQHIGKKFLGHAASLAPEQFHAVLSLAERLAQKKIDPAWLLQEGVPAVVSASPSPSDFSENLAALETLLDCARASTNVVAHERNFNFIGGIPLQPLATALGPEQFREVLAVATRLRNKGVHPAWALREGIPAIVAADPSSAAFLDNLSIIERLLERWDASHSGTATPKIQGSIDRVSLQPLAKELNPAQFKDALRLAVALVDQRLDPTGTLQGLIAIAKMSFPGLFRASLALAYRLGELNVSPGPTLQTGVPSIVSALSPAGILDGLVLALAVADCGKDPTPVLAHGMVPLANLASDSRRLADGMDLLLRLAAISELQWQNVALQPVLASAMVLAEKGVGYTIILKPEEGHSETNYDMYSTSYETYVVDVPQSVTLECTDKNAAAPAIPLLFEDSFLRKSGVLEAVRAAFPHQTSSGEDTEITRRIIARSTLGDGVSFAAEYIGKLPRYFPYSAYGFNYVLRLCRPSESGTLAAVRRVIARGHIDSSLHYEIISREEFEELLANDGLDDWPMALRQTGRLLSAISAEHTLRQLEARNWWWTSLCASEGESRRKSILERIEKLKTDLGDIQTALTQAGIIDIVSLFALGSAVREDTKPNDLDLMVVTRGARLFEVKSVYRTGIALDVRVIGLDSLAAAVEGRLVENHKRIRLEAVMMYGSAVLIAGLDFFEGLRVPPANLRGALDHFQATRRESERKAPSPLPDREAAKFRRWDEEIQALSRLLAAGAQHAASKQGT